MRKTSKFIVCLSSLALTLSGCALSTGQSATTSPSAASATTGAGSSTDPSSSSSAKPSKLQSLDFTLLTDARTDSLSEGNAEGSWYKVPSAEFVSVPSSYVKAKVDAWNSAHTNSADHLTILPSLTASNVVAVGVRFLGKEEASGKHSSVVRTFWFDVEAKKTVNSKALFKEDKLQALVEAVGKELGQMPGIPEGTAENLASADAASLFEGAKFDSINFGKDGTLLVELDNKLGAPIEIQLDSKTSESWLSDFGLNARAAAMNPRKVNLAAPSQSKDPTKPGNATGKYPGHGSPQKGNFGPVLPPVDGPDCTNIKCIALTFDDGPGPYTAGLLDVLKSEGVHATFFMVGQNVKEHPDLLRRMVSEGNEVANHSWSHPSLPTLSDVKLSHEVVDTANEITKSAGVAPRLMRPPYGALSGRVKKFLAKQPGGVIALWNIDTLDWKTRNTNSTIEAVKREARRGSIILMHDIHKPSVQAVPEIIKFLKSEGYTMVTVSQLLNAEQIRPGQVHTEQ